MERIRNRRYLQRKIARKERLGNQDRRKRKIEGVAVHLSYGRGRTRYLYLDRRYAASKNTTQTKSGEVLWRKRTIGSVGEEHIYFLGNGVRPPHRKKD